MTVASTNL